MLTFFICDDNKEFLNKLNNIVNNYMMRNDFDFQILSYGKIDNKIKEDLKNIDGFKVFILDIEVNEESGIELTRYIREEENDWNSIIMLITAHNELKYDVLSKRLYIFNFINKLDSYEKILMNDFDCIISHFENRKKKYTYKEDKVIKSIDFNEIIYFEKIKDSNKLLIKTISKNIEIVENINTLFDKLDKRFIKINRGLIINKDKVKEYNLNDNSIVLEKEIIFYDLNKRYKKAINNEL